MLHFLITMGKNALIWLNAAAGTGDRHGLVNS